MVEAREQLLLFCGMHERERQAHDPLCERVRQLFLATAKAVVTEQVQAWTEASEFLTTVGGEVLRNNETVSSSLTTSSGDAKSQEDMVVRDGRGREGVEDEEGAVVDYLRVLETSLPPLPFSSSVVMYGSLLLASPDDVRKALARSGPPKAAHGREMEVAAPTRQGLGFGLDPLRLVKGRSASTTTPSKGADPSAEDRDAIVAGAEGEAVVSTSQPATGGLRQLLFGGEDRDTGNHALDWVTVRAVVTTDNLLHLFQPRMDGGEETSVHEADRFGDGLVLLKSLQLKVRD